MWGSTRRCRRCAGAVVVQTAGGEQNRARVRAGGMYALCAFEGPPAEEEGTTITGDRII